MGGRFFYVRLNAEQVLHGVEHISIHCVKKKAAPIGAAFDNLSINSPNAYALGKKTYRIFTISSAFDDGEPSTSFICNEAAVRITRGARAHGWSLASFMLGIPNPRVGLISIGGEDVKGNPLIKKANELFREDASLNFVGNVEGRELFSGACEIGIADGFVGNVVLKLAEGVAEGIFKTLAREVRAECQDLAKRLDPIFAKIWEKHDYSEAGGAPLLGVNGYCIICHGSSDSRAIRNAIRAARDLVAKRMNEVIAERLSEVTADA